MYSGRTGERIDMIYWIEGEYIGEALHEITYFMRDWRNDKVMNIDTAHHRHHGRLAQRCWTSTEPYMLLSGYRSPETNAMLRARSSGVAKNSLHMQGQAADLRLAVALGQPDGARRARLPRRRRRPLPRLELRAHGLRPGPHLGRLNPGTTGS